MVHAISKHEFSSTLYTKYLVLLTLTLQYSISFHIKITNNILMFLKITQFSSTNICFKEYQTLF